MQEDERTVLTDETIRQQILEDHKPNLYKCIFPLFIGIIFSFVLHAICGNDYLFLIVCWYVFFSLFTILFPLNYLIFHFRVIKQGNFFVTEEVFVDYSVEMVKWYPNDGILIFDDAYYKKFKRIDMLTETEKERLGKDKTFYVVRSCFGKHTILRIYNKRSYKYDI